MQFHTFTLPPTFSIKQVKVYLPSLKAITYRPFLFPQRTVYNILMHLNMFRCAHSKNTSNLCNPYLHNDINVKWPLTTDPMQNTKELNGARDELTKGFLQLTSLHSFNEPSRVQLSQTSKLWLANTNSILLFICNSEIEHKSLYNRYPIITSLNFNNLREELPQSDNITSYCYKNA